MNRWGKPLLLVSVLLISILVFSGCNISLSKNQTIPPTITVQAEFPEVQVVATIVAEVIENPTETPMAEAPEAEEAVVEEKAIPTETPTPEEVPTAEELAGAKEVLLAEEAATATRIPANGNGNPDAIVFFSKAVGCYLSPDVNSYNYGTVSAGTAGQAFARIGNFYQVSHPNQARVVCWVVGEGISPNAPAFNLPESAGETNEVSAASTATPMPVNTATAMPPTATNTPMPVSGTITPTEIPANSNANPDAIVFFYAPVGCYKDADVSTSNYGTVPAGTAGQAFARIGNFYQVSHPARPGVICWVTGDGVSPNWPAFNLSH